MKNDSVSSNKRLALNLSASFISFLVTFGISFFLSPYIVEKVGVDAYGFVGLANNFVSFASLITIALNVLAGRFITVKIYENNYEEANRYFTSVLTANVIISCVMTVALAIIWIFLDLLINIPVNLFVDVKILFAALFFECILNTAGSVFSVSTFATNKLYLNSLRTIESSIGRAVILIVLFVFFAPNVCYLGITAVLMAVYCMVFNIHYTRKLLPFIKVRKKYFNFGYIKVLVTSGVWALIIRLGQLLSDGFDLLISNILIDPIAMGVLSLAKTVPMLISAITCILVGVFSPNFTILYARKENERLLREVRRAMKLMGIIVNIPIIVLIVCGKDFFRLWQPTQNAGQLQLLSVLTCCGLIVSGGINCLYDIFTVVNKIKENAIAVLVGGAASILITFILLMTTDLGIYAIAAVSSAVNIIRNIVFTAPFGAKCLGKKWYAFYPDIIKPVIYDAVCIAIGILILLPIPCTGWFMLIVKGGIVSIIAVWIGAFLFINKEERTLIRSKIRKVIRH